MILNKVARLTRKSQKIAKVFSETLDALSRANDELEVHIAKKHAKATKALSEASDLHSVKMQNETLHKNISKLFESDTSK